MKILLYSVIIAVYGYACAWVFNHSGFPWLSHLMVLLAVAYIFNAILKNTTKAK